MSWFGEDIDKLFIYSNMENDYVPVYGMISKEMLFDVYVFGS
jgi:hypothetical protein